MKNQDILISEEQFSIDTSLEDLNDHQKDWDTCTIGIAVNDSIVPVETVKIRDAVRFEIMELELTAKKFPFYGEGYRQGLPVLEKMLYDILSKDNKEKINLIYGSSKIVHPVEISKNVEFKDASISAFNIDEGRVSVTFICAANNISYLTDLGHIVVRTDGQDIRY